MDFMTVQNTIYNYTEEEIFYRKYFYARQQEYSLQEFMAKIDMDFVYKHRMFIPDIPRTIPDSFRDEYYFPRNVNSSIITLRHNRYTPAIMHDQTYFELIYVYDGICALEICDRKIELKNGDICIVPPGIKHSIGVFDDSIILKCLIRKNTLHNMFFGFLSNFNILSAFFLNNIYSGSGNSYIIFHTGQDMEIRRGFVYCYWETVNQEIYFDQMISHVLMITFGLLIRNYESSTEMPMFNQKSEVQRFALVQYIQEHFTDVTLSDVANHFHYTPEYTSHLIKKTTNMTFTEILRIIRLEQAEIMLADTNMSVANIAAQVGYANTEHFIRLFKAKTNMTPTQYRKAENRE